MSQYHRARWLLSLAALMVLTQACSALSMATQPIQAVTEPAPIPTTAAPLVTKAPAPSTTPTSLPAGTPTSALEALCPSPGQGVFLYKSEANGFCLLYPDDFTVQPDPLRPEEVLFLLGPRETDKPKTQEEISVVMTVAYNGLADRLDSPGYARKWYELYGPKDGTPSENAQATVGGLQAVVLSNLPGFVAQRSAFVVANGIKYQITLSPQPEDMPELAEAAGRAWEIVTGSIYFFPPQNRRVVRRPEQVCPQESGDMRLYSDEMNGYCFLYPADFAPDPAFPGMVKGGPVLGQWEAGDIITYVALGTFGHFEGQTPRQVLEPRMDQIDAASVQDATIGGYPAVTFRSLQGPWPSRQAMIVVDGDVYTIVGEPWDPQRYPDGIPYLDRLWEAVTGSLAFFEPWR